MQDDTQIIRKVLHEVGMDIDRLSVNELRERIGLLHHEIARLEKEIGKKDATRSAAEQAFKL